MDQIEAAPGIVWRGIAWSVIYFFPVKLMLAQISIKNVSVCQEIIEILISYNGYLFHSYLGLICFVLGFSSGFSQSFVTFADVGSGGYSFERERNMIRL